MAKASDFEGKKPEELFYFVDYSPEEAERIGYSNYSYWGSVIQNFLQAEGRCLLPDPVSGADGVLLHCAERWQVSLHQPGL